MTREHTEQIARASGDTKPSVERGGARHVVKRRDARGIVMIEFLIALMPVMIAFLGFTQFCFAGIAKLMVRHAAAMATRAAVVVIEEAVGIPGAPKDAYKGFKAGGLEVDRPTGSSSGPTASEVGAVTSATSPDKSGADNVQDLLGSVDRKSSRIRQIRTAAFVPLLALSPSLLDDGVDIGTGISRGQLIPKQTVRRAIGGSDPKRMLGALLYNLGAVAVTFPKEAGKPELSEGLFTKPDDVITAKVTYLFRCQVPLASLLMCASGWSMLFGDGWFDPSTLQTISNMVGHPPTNAEDLPNWTGQWKEQKQVAELQQKRVNAFMGHEKEFKQVEWPFMLDVLLAVPGARYMVLTAEASLPLQGAHYYPRADKNDMEEMWKRQEKELHDHGVKIPDVRGTLRDVAHRVHEAVDEMDEAVKRIEGKIREIAGEVMAELDAAKQKVRDVERDIAKLVGDAQKKFDDVARAVAGKVSEAQTKLTSIVNSAQTTLDGIRTKAQGLIDEAQAKVDAAKRELEAAQSKGAAAVAAAEQKLRDAEGALKTAQDTAAHMIGEAERTYADTVSAAQGEFDKVKADGQALLGSAQSALDGAKTEGQRLLGDAHAAYNSVLDKAQGAVNEGLGAARDKLQEASNTANGVVDQAASLGKGLVNQGVQVGVEQIEGAGKQLLGNLIGGASDAVSNVKGTAVGYGQQGLDAVNKYGGPAAAPLTGVGQQALNAGDKFADDKTQQGKDWVQGQGDKVTQQGTTLLQNTGKTANGYIDTGANKTKGYVQQGTTELGKPLGTAQNASDGAFGAARQGGTSVRNSADNVLNTGANSGKKLLNGASNTIQNAKPPTPGSMNVSEF